jgi:hypothetical protein
MIWMTWRAVAGSGSVQAAVHQRIPHWGDLRDETGDAARGPRYARSVRRSILRRDVYPRRKKILADGRMKKAGALQLRSLVLKFPS